MKLLTKAIAVMSVFAMSQNIVFADEGRHDHDGHHDEQRYENHEEHHDFGHDDIRHFHDHDLEIWLGGHWYHGRHGGHNAWWWISGGLWYPYGKPVYPYPDPYQPPTTVITQPPVSVNPTNPQPAAYWYYCSNPAGYYPYVPQCQTGWQKVPANSTPDAP